MTRDPTGPEGQTAASLAEAAVHRWVYQGSASRWGMGSGGPPSERERTAYWQGYVEACTFWTRERRRLLTLARLTASLALHPYSKHFRARRHKLFQALDRRQLWWGPIGLPPRVPLEQFRPEDSP